MATIDGTDIRAAWGLTVLDGTYSSLFKYPKRKAVRYTNFAEKDGIHPDLRRFQVEPRTVTLRFGMRYGTAAEFYARYESFFRAMTEPGYRAASLGNGLTHRLRYAGTGVFTPVRLFSAPTGGLATVEMNFIEDEPPLPLSGGGGSGAGGVYRSGYYAVDGRDFAGFGILPEGDAGAALKYPDVKPPFTDGRTIYLNRRMLAHKEVTLRLSMLADTPAEFVQNWQAFFGAFARPGRQQLYLREIGKAVDAYYVDCPSFDVVWGVHRIGAHFEMKFVLPGGTGQSGVTGRVSVLRLLDGRLLAVGGKVIAFNNR